MNDDVMVSKATGHVLQVASSDFFIDERGMLTSRVLADGDMNSNVTIDGARRRLLSEVVVLDVVLVVLVAAWSPIGWVIIFCADGCCCITHPCSDPAVHAWGVFKYRTAHDSCPAVVWAVFSPQGPTPTTQGRGGGLILPCGFLD